MSNALQSKVAIITGAGRGIGRCIAETLAREGAQVALAARSADELDAVASHITRAGGTAVAIPTDMTDEAQIIALVNRTVATCGQLDILVNNAGIGRFGRVADTPTATWDEVLAVNARGPFLLCREALPHLQRQSVSHIVNITSVVGVKGYANQSVYSASKHAVMGFTKALAREVQDAGVRVHAICPGGVDTDMVGNARPDLDRSELIAPRDVADAVRYLVTQTGNGVIDEIHIRRRSGTPWA